MDTLKKNCRFSKTINLGLNFTVDTQNPDGSWNGPVSGRLYETSIFALCLYCARFHVPNKTYAFVKKSRPQLIPLEAKEIEKGLKIIFIQKKIPANIKKIFRDSKKGKYQRKFLIVLLFSHLLNPVPEKSLKQILRTCDKLIISLKDSKGWDLIECLLIKAILVAKYNKKIHELFHKLPKNAISSSLFFLYLYRIKKYKLSRRIKNEIALKEDGSLGYYEIPIWDTALVLGTQKVFLQKTVFEKGLNYLLANPCPGGGWGFAPKGPIELDTTSIILAYLNENLSNSIVGKVLKKIKEKKLESNKLWPVWKKNESPSIEVIAHIIWAIKKCSADKISTTEAKRWIEHRIKKNNILAEWCLNYPYSIYSILRAVGERDNVKRKLLHQLIIRQNRNGGWGWEKNRKSNCSATANAVSCLIDFMPDKKYSIIKGVDFLLDNFTTTEGSWPAPKEVFGPRPFLYSIKSSCHSFCMEALIKFFIYEHRQKYTT
jgi:hypothetical protein